MKKLVILLLVALVACAIVLAHEKKTGILADAKCAAGMNGDSAKAAGHKVACAIGCKDSGFGIIADGKFYKFDDAGNKQALALLKATDKVSAMKVSVNGHVKNDMIEVASMEAAE